MLPSLTAILDELTVWGLERVFLFFPLLSGEWINLYPNFLTKSFTVFIDFYLTRRFAVSKFFP